MLVIIMGYINKVNITAMLCTFSGLTTIYAGTLCCSKAYKQLVEC